MFNQITDDVFIGSAADALHRPIDLLNGAGITAILNVAKDLSNIRQIHNHFMMCHIPLTDGGANSIKMCELAVEALQAMLDDGHRVMVHCHVGRSRSVGVVATWMVKQGMAASLDEAELFIKTKRPIAEIQPDLKNLFVSTLEN